MNQSCFTDESRNSPQMTSGEVVRATLIGEDYRALSPVKTPAWLSHVEAQLESLLNLPENWDSYQGAAPTEKAVASARGLIRTLVNQASLNVPPYVAPTCTGGVFLSWERGPLELEVDLVSPDAASFVFENVQSGKLVTGYLFRDDASGGDFCRIVHQHFS